MNLLLSCTVFYVINVFMIALYPTLMICINSSLKAVKFTVTVLLTLQGFSDDHIPRTFAPPSDSSFIYVGKMTAFD